MYNKFTMVVAWFIFISIFSNFANAGFFGPSNYEECVLDNMKGVTNDVAAYSVRNACKQKFPDASKSSKYQPNLYRINASQGPRDREVVNNLEVLRRYPGGIQVMNRNSFAITGIFIGDIAKGVKTCPTTEKDFGAIHWCYGNVGPNLAGRVTCADDLGSFCITGLRTQYLDEPEKFFNDNGF